MRGLTFYKLLKLSVFDQQPEYYIPVYLEGQPFDLKLRQDPVLIKWDRDAVIVPGESITRAIYIPVQAGIYVYRT